MARREIEAAARESDPWVRASGIIALGDVDRPTATELADHWLRDDKGEGLLSSPGLTPDVLAVISIINIASVSEARAVLLRWINAPNNEGAVMVALDCIGSESALVCPEILRRVRDLAQTRGTRDLAHFVLALSGDTESANWLAEHVDQRSVLDVVLSSREAGKLVDSAPRLTRQRILEAGREYWDSSDLSKRLAISRFEIRSGGTRGYDVLRELVENGAGDPAPGSPRRSFALLALAALVDLPANDDVVMMARRMFHVNDEQIRVKAAEVIVKNARE